MGHRQPVETDVSNLYVGDLFSTDRTGRTVCYIGSASIGNESLPAFVEVDNRRGYVLVHDDVIVARRANLSPSNLASHEDVLNSLRPFLKSLHPDKATQVWSLPNFDSEYGHIEVGGIKGTGNPKTGDVVTSHLLGRPLIYCGEFRGEWVLCEVGDNEGRYVFSQPHSVDVVGIEVVEKFAAKVLDEVKRRPLPGSRIYLGKGRDAIYLGRTDPLSPDHFVALEGRGNGGGINFSFRGTQWHIKTMLPELIGAHDLPEDDGVELLIHIRGLLSS